MRPALVLHDRKTCRFEALLVAVETHSASREPSELRPEHVAHRALAAIRRFCDNTRGEVRRGRSTANDPWHASPQISCGTTGDPRYRARRNN